MGGHDPNAQTDVSAVLVKLKGGGTTGFTLDQLYNKQGHRLTFAWPISAVVADLFTKLNWVDRVLAVIAWLVVLVAMASVLASTYNSMNERRRDLAILRALGARRVTLFTAVVTEATTIAAFGIAGGHAAFALIMTAVRTTVQAQTGVVLAIWRWDPVFLLAPIAILTLGALAGLLPALKAYRTEVADNLSPHA